MKGVNSLRFRTFNVVRCALLLALLDSQAAFGSSDADTTAPGRTVTRDGSIRPFQAHVPDDVLDDLRRRTQATRWPDKETVDDRSQDAQLANVQELVRYWVTGYNWRKAEAKLNSLPQFMTTIDGVDIHFIHVRSKHPNWRVFAVGDVRSGHLKRVAAAVGERVDGTGVRSSRAAQIAR